jgi:energy-coupling factor transporter transmembrane protein EcfT
VRKYIPILIPLIIEAIRMAEGLSIAIDSRAFGKGERTYLRELHFGKRDALVTVVMCAGVVLCVVMRMKGYGVMVLP